MNRVVELGLPAHHHHERGRVPLPDQPQGLQPVRSRRHLEIEQDRVGVELVEREERRVAVGRLLGLEPFRLEQRGEHPADVRLVIHDQHSRLHSVLRRRSATRRS